MTSILSSNPHLRGHLLQFDPSPTPGLGTGAGIRLLSAAILLEVARLAAVEWLRPSLPLAVLLPSLLALALVALPVIAGVGLAQLGLRPWRDWTTTERSYFIQVLVIANVVFLLVLGPPDESRAESGGLAWTLGRVFLPYFCYGFTQELVYRGAVQTALVRLWDVRGGILAANVLYTFGPLHWSYFSAPLSLGVPMFLAIFAVGLYFGFLYERSGNLWLAAVFHAIGNAYMVWSVGPLP